MMARLFFLLLVCCVAKWSLAATNPYAVAHIQPQMLEKANRVLRQHEMRFEILNNQETVLYERYVLTILDESADDHARFFAYYGKMYKVSSIEGALYDRDGKLVRRLKQKEISDHSAVDDISLMDDSRLKTHHFAHTSYPYTVEYEVVRRYSNSYAFPKWMPVKGENVSVEQSTFTVRAPENYNLRYKAFNYTGQPREVIEKGKKILSWEAKNLKAVVLPYAAPRWDEMTTFVHLAPSTFNMEGYEGDASTWESLGRFQVALNANRDVLPESIRTRVTELTKNATTDEERIRILYDYLQKNTRYISIQLGIGGLQPFDASFVANKGYGDCKALSNYMYSLLKATGIKSYYTWVNGGRSKDDRFIMEDFPSDQFNHIILCVPLKKDTMWLECTSQSAPAGYMGSFTGNRKVLLITEEGGKLVPTPRYGVEENLQLRRVEGQLDAAGNLVASVITSYRAIQQDALAGYREHYTADRFKEYLNKRFALPSYEVLHFNYTQVNDRLPVLRENLQLQVNHYATITGKRLFLTPNLLNQVSRQLQPGVRTVDIDLSESYRDIDTVMISIPEGYVTEVLPQPVSIRSRFGTYETITEWKGTSIRYIRKHEQFGGRYPASDYKDLVAFQNEIYKADRTRIVLVKKE